MDTYFMELFLFSLQESDPVVQFSENNLMKVNFSPRLTILLIEVRQLLSMGYRIPHPITDVVTHARKFLRYAKILEQVIFILLLYLLRV